jgi:predicted Fe-Mo cluster-binding NifX family protein
MCVCVCAYTGQKFVAEVEGTTLVFTVVEINVVNIESLKLSGEPSEQNNSKSSSKSTCSLKKKHKSVPYLARILTLLR